MNRHIDVRSVAVVEFDHLMRLAVDGGRHQSAELGYSVVGMYDVVAYPELVDLAQSDDGFAATSVLTRKRDTVITLENLMVGVAADLQPLVHKPFVQRAVDADEQSIIRSLRLIIERQSRAHFIIKRSAHDRLQAV